MFILTLAIILLASKVAGDISVRLGQPSVLGKLIVGILVGPAVFGIIEESEMITELSEIGVILLMFIAGLETDLDEFKRSGKSSAAVGILGVVFPLGFGFLAGIVFGFSVTASVFLGLLLSATSVSISVQSLKELGKLQSKEGATILGAAVIDDILVIVALAFVMSFSAGDMNLGFVIGKKVVFFVIAILAAWKLVPWLLKRFAALQVSQSVITGALILCFVFAFFAEYTGVAAIIGAYIAGLSISVTDFRERVFEKAETIAYSFFVPIFFTSIGLAVDFSGMKDNLLLIVIFSIIAILTKLIGGTLAARFSAFNWKSSLGIGSAMISRGEVALIIASIGVEADLMSKETFSVMVIVVLITTIVTPPLIKWFFTERTPSGSTYSA
ncbi:cation:proton antiporter [Peribacillus kribbensis]|uniref:cation:proton antiporter n=1 Tax=Peribacillus kribbensis TaxID=356658 RepID=UPI000410A0C2|nr:cation:proton antiporter [Peribacillus kribbensis]